MDLAVQEWAEDVFGDVDLGDRRRRDRLVRLAAQAAASPAGTVTSVVEGSAAREGAYRLLESSKAGAAAVTEAMCRSTARACASTTARACTSERLVYIAIDGSSLSLTDRVGKREVGGVGSWKQGGRGLQVISALAVSSSGAPLGVCGQTWWARKTRSVKRKTSRHAMETETRHGAELLQTVHARVVAEAPGVKAWFQLDRGYDVWPVLLAASKEKICVTVRAAHNRCVREHRLAKARSLFTLARRAPFLGKYEVEVPARNGRPARTAQMDVRARRVTLELRVGSKRCEHISMNVVYAKERRRNAPLEWTLLTNASVESFEDAERVVDGYTTRWRIEEFHRAWKTGGCNVEGTQLRRRDGIIKWATILAAVAARATRLTYLAREKPEISATSELTRYEIDAAIALLRPKGIKLGAEPTLAVVVQWIAEIGGYTGKSSGGPPGPTVVSRGLDRVESFAKGLKNLERLR